MIVGILGFRGTGKDTVANILYETGKTQKIGFADALKRTCRDIFEFSYEQLWGTQEQKETPDKRYPREHTWSYGPTGLTYICKCCGADRYSADLGECYLTPRYAMQIMGTEGARHCWGDIWVEKAVKDARRIERGLSYVQYLGLDPDFLAGTHPRNAVFIDNRFINEVGGIWKVGGSVYRLKRSGFEKPAYEHASETEQLKIPDDKLQGVILNDGSLEDLKDKVLDIIGKRLQ